MARDWTPAQIFTRLAAMISPPQQRRLVPIENRVAVSDVRTTFGQRPSPTKASRRTKKRQ